jgi:hypothetical protein
VDIFGVQRITGLARASTLCCSAIRLRAMIRLSSYTASILSTERLLCMSQSSRLFCSGSYHARANYIRAQDRLYNKTRYPDLTYPTIWILKGGYKSFYDVHNTLCEPRGYVAERDRDQKALLRPKPRNRFREIEIDGARRNLIKALRNA